MSHPLKNHPDLQSLRDKPKPRGPEQVFFCELRAAIRNPEVALGEYGHYREVDRDAWAYHDTGKRSTWSGESIMTRTWSPARRDAASKAFWAGFDGRKNSGQYRIGSKEIVIFEAGADFRLTLGEKPKGKRKILVDGKEYLFRVGKRFTDIDGFGLIENKDIGTKVRVKDDYVYMVTPGMIADKISNKQIRTASYCNYHQVQISNEEWFDPFDAEIHGISTPMHACPECYHDRRMDI